MTIFDLCAERVLRAQRTILFEATRFGLTGVHIEPIEGGGVWIVATDGKMMLVQRDTEGSAPRSGTFRFHKPEELHEPCECGCFDPGGTWKGCRIKFPDDVTAAAFAAPVFWGRWGESRHLLAEPITGPYPPWRKALSPTHISKQATSGSVKGPRNALSAQLLARVVDGRHGIRVHQPATVGAPFYITFSSDPDAMAIIAPTSFGSSSAAVLPELLNALGRPDLTVEYTA